MKQIRRASGHDVWSAVAPVYLKGVKMAIKFCSPGMTVKATLQGRRDNRSRGVTILLTIGKPNYWEREYIKTAKKAKQPFPFGPVYRDR